LPYLLAIAEPSVSPRFVEIGAYNGIDYSNTFVLEKCFGWGGLLIEANPTNFADLQLANRAAALVGAGVCDPPGTMNITATGGTVAGDPSSMTNTYKQYWNRRNNALSADGVVNIPCRSMASMMNDVSMHTAEFLSLDVEGAEDKVLATVDVSRFSLILVEQSNEEHNPKDAAVRTMIEDAGLVQLSEASGIATIGPNEVYISQSASLRCKAAGLTV